MVLSSPKVPKHLHTSQKTLPHHCHGNLTSHIAENNLIYAKGVQEGTSRTSFICKLASTLKPQKEVPLMVGITALEGMSSLPGISVFSPSAL
jgi:hypothetical protein